MKNDVKSQDEFDYYWNIDDDFVDEINKRGKGWSGVIITRDEKSLDGNGDRICIKKQEDYVSYSLLHPFKGTPTTEKELHNLIYCGENGIRTPKVIFAGRRMVSGKLQAILVTTFLEGFTPLSEIVDNNKQKTLLDEKLKKSLILQIAHAVRDLHATRLAHNNLYPKHIFIDFETLNIAFIDLEKSQIKSSSSACLIRDFDTLNRRSPSVSIKDKLTFLKAYFDSKVLTPAIRKVWKALAKKAERKLRKKAVSR